jgi:TonB family protein
LRITPSAFVGNNQFNVVNAFTQLGESAFINTPINKKTPITQSAKEKMIEKKALTISHNTSINKIQPAHTSLSGSQSHGDQSNELLALLHAAIEAQQQYPDSALQLGREGLVTVQFLLNQNGQASDIKIAKTSGTMSLDEAAIIAVKNASPFVNIEKYLKSPEIYQIDVVFTLT